MVHGSIFFSAFVTAARDTCPSNSFACVSGIPHCVPNTSVCNGKSNCQDGSDESLSAQCGAVGAVAHVVVVGTVGSESNSIIITWSAPNKTNGQNSKQFQYFVEYCDNMTCTNTSLGGATAIELTGLSPNHDYSYKIVLLDSNMVHGSIFFSAFVTAERDTCKSNSFACVSGIPHCVPNASVCNGKSNCQDGSDESLSAQCGAVGAVAHVVVVGTVGSESNSIIITWSAPNKTNGQNSKQFQYFVEYCYNMTCTNTSLGGATAIELTGLSPNHDYSYKIFLLDSNMVHGSIFFSAFVTAERDTCPSNSFACVTGIPYCVLNASVCNSKPNCQDGSDESLSAQCGAVGAVTNVAYVGKVGSESKSLIIIWSAPNKTNSQNSKQFQYVVENCDNMTCTNTSLSGATYIELTGLRPNHHYFYKIFVLDSNMVDGSIFFGAFVTAARDTCRWNSFACVSGIPHCVPSASVCNGESNCQDGSDESLSAQCGAVGAVTNVAYAGKVGSESKSVIITWSAPNKTNGQNNKQFQYVLENCDNKTCTNTSLGGATYIELTGLSQNHHYSYKVFVLDSNMVHGSIFFGAFVTAARDTCASNSFACVSGIPHCVPNASVCNGDSNCQDGSDESVSAQCGTVWVIRDGNDAGNLYSESSVATSSDSVPVIASIAVPLVALFTVFILLCLMRKKMKRWLKDRTKRNTSIGEDLVGKQNASYSEEKFKNYNNNAKENKEEDDEVFNQDNTDFEAFKHLTTPRKLPPSKRRPSFLPPLKLPSFSSEDKLHSQSSIDGGNRLRLTSILSLPETIEGDLKLWDKEPITPITDMFKHTSLPQIENKSLTGGNMSEGKTLPLTKHDKTKKSAHSNEGSQNIKSISQLKVNFTKSDSNEKLSILSSKIHPTKILPENSTINKKVTNLSVLTPSQIPKRENTLTSTVNKRDLFTVSPSIKKKKVTNSSLERINQGEGRILTSPEIPKRENTLAATVNKRDLFTVSPSIKKKKVTHLSVERINQGESRILTSPGIPKRENTLAATVNKSDLFAVSPSIKKKKVTHLSVERINQGDDSDTILTSPQIPKRENTLAATVNKSDLFAVSPSIKKKKNTHLSVERINKGEDSATVLTSPQIPKKENTLTASVNRSDLFAASPSIKRGNKIKTFFRPVTAKSDVS